MQQCEQTGRDIMTAKEWFDREKMLYVDDGTGPAVMHLPGNRGKLTAETTDEDIEIIGFLLYQFAMDNNAMFVNGISEFVGYLTDLRNKMPKRTADG